MDLVIETNIPEVTRELDELARRQIPFATSLAINNTAKIAREEERKGIFERFDVRNEAYVGRAVRMKASNKRNLEATLTIQDAFLVQHEEGGIRRPGDVMSSIVEPIDPGEGRIGVFRGRKLRGKDTPKNVLRRSRGKPGRPKGRKSGENARRKKPTPFITHFRSGKKAVVIRAGPQRRPLNLLFTFERKQNLRRKRLQFETTVNSAVARAFEREFGRALARAYATAK